MNSRLRPTLCNIINTILTEWVMNLQFHTVICNLNEIPHAITLLFVDNQDNKSKLGIMPAKSD